MTTEAQKPKILIIEDDRSTQALFRKVFPDDWFEVTIAGDGQQGLDLYSSVKPHIIVLDMMLPVINGFTVLKTIRKKHKDSATPIHLATSISSKSDILEFTKLGIQGYILKPFNFKELRKKFAPLSPLSDLAKLESVPKNLKSTSGKPSGRVLIQNYFKSVAEEKIGIDEACTKIMEASKAQKLDLPSMPDIVLKIQKSMSSADATYKKLAQLIINDQNLTSKLISLSNSAFYGASKKCTTLEEAIVRVGLSEAKEIALVLSNRGLYALHDKRLENDLKLLAKHSIASGVAGRMLAEHLKFKDAFFTFTLGSLHDIGRLLIVRIFSDAFKGEENLDLDLLHNVSNLLHVKMGGMLLEGLGFPTKFQTILLKHEKHAQDFDRIEKEIPAVVLSSLLASKFGFPSTDNPAEVDIFQTKAAKHVKLNEALTEKIGQGINRYFEMLGPMT